MRILLHGAPPWAHSGYGTQARVAAEVLTGLGHDVALSVYAGVHEDRQWHGMTVLGCGSRPYGNGVIALNYRQWEAELLITLCDLFTLEPDQFAGMAVAPWVPVDTDKVGYMNAAWLRRVHEVTGGRVWPVAMSAHGQACLRAAGWRAPVVPLVAEGFGPAPKAGAGWRAGMGMTQNADPAARGRGDQFVIGKVGVNDTDDRKAFVATLAAFSLFAPRHRDAVLYLHCDGQAAKSPNLVAAAADLGLKGRVVFCDQDRRRADRFTGPEMAAMYNGLDVLEACSKGEGFGVPIVEALRCGTPVIASRNSAAAEKIGARWGWLVDGQPEWARHHLAWWQAPLVSSLVQAYERAYTGARMMRAAAAAEGGRWSADAMRRAWVEALGPVLAGDRADLTADPAWR